MTLKTAPRRRGVGLRGITATLVAFTILVSMGVWQMQRLVWKMEMMADFESRSKLAPVEIAQAKPPLQDQLWRPVTATGTWLPVIGLPLGPRTLEGRPGFFIFAPLQLANGRIVFVNRGWSPTLEEAEPPQGTVVRGILRAAAKGRFTPDNMPEKDLWYWPDLGAMAEAMRFDRDNTFTDVYVQQDGDSDGYPKTVPAMPDFRNDHLQYAIFWFVMAGILAVFFVLVWRRGPSADDEDAL